MLIFLHTKIYKNHVKEQVPYLCQKFQMVLHLQHHCETDLRRILKKSITPNIYEFQIQSFFLFGLRPDVVRNIFIITFVDKSCSWLRSLHGNTKWWGRLLSFNNCIRSWCQRFGVEACQGGVCNAVVSKFPLCQGGVWVCDCLEFSRSWGTLRLPLHLQLHLQPLLTCRKCLITMRINATVVTVPHANTPNKEREQN